jgi:hypothetical protein
LEEGAEGVGGALGEPSGAPLADRFGQSLIGGFLGLVAALGSLASTAGERVGSMSKCQVQVDPRL